MTLNNSSHKLFSAAKTIYTRIGIIALVLLPGTFSTVNADDVYSDLGTSLNERNTLSDKLCEKAAYSAAYDRWLKAYLKGDDAAAEKGWAEVLQVAHGVTDLRQLLRLTHSRLAFTDTDAPANRLNSLECDKFILKYTEKALGVNAEPVESICSFIAGAYHSQKDYNASFYYHKKAAAAIEKAGGPADERLCNAWRDCADNLILGKHFDEARVYAEKIIALGRMKKKSECQKTGEWMEYRIQELGKHPAK